MLLLLFLTIKTVSISVAPTWLTSPYVQADTRYVIDSTVTGAPVGSSVTPTSTMPFVTAFTSIPSLGYGICNYEGNDYMGEEMFDINRTNLNTTHFRVQVQIYSITNIWMLGVRYIAISASFPHHLNSFDNVPINYGSTLTNITSSSFTANTYTNVINYTSHANSLGFTYNKFTAPYSNFKIILFLTTMFEDGTYDMGFATVYPLDFRISTQILTDSTYRISVTFGILARITRLHFSVIIFDQADVQSSGQYLLIYEKFDFPKTGGFQPIPSAFYGNAILGFIQFSSNQTAVCIHFKISFQTVFGVDGAYMAASNPRPNPLPLNRFGFSMFYMKTWLCPNGTLFNITSGLCQTCTLSNCLVCSSFVACSVCDEANQFYLNSSTLLCDQMLDVCGDGLTGLTEECDDGNLLDQDGCSSLCIIEANFSCSINNQSNTTISICFYSGQITLNVLYIQKMSGANQIQILLEIGPVFLTLWDRVDFTSIVNISDMTGFNSYTVQRNADGTVSIVANYDQDINNREITVVVDPSRSGESAFSLTPTATKTFPVIANDNQAVSLYDQSVYDIANIISILAYVTSGLALLIFLLGVFARKLIGVETVAVVQASYLSLLTLPPMNPCFSALTSLKYVNGFNLFSLDKRYLLDTETPIQVKGLFFFSRYFENYNLTFALIVVPWLLAFFCLCLSKMIVKSNEQRSKKLMKAAKVLVCEVAYNGVLFSGYIMSLSLALQLIYGLKHQLNFVGLFSLVECGVLSLIYLTYFVLIMVFPKHFGEFVSYFKNKNGNRFTKYTNQQKMMKLNQPQSNQGPCWKRIHEKWYNGLMVERVAIGSCLILALSVQMSNLIIISIYALLIFLVILVLPYKKMRNNLRFICNMLICIFVQVIYLCQKESILQNWNQNTKIWIFMPFAVCGLLIVCIIYNFIILIKEILQQKKRQKLQNILETDISEANRLMKGIVPQSSLNQPYILETQADSLLQSPEQRKALDPIKQVLKKMKNQLKVTQQVKKNVNVSDFVEVLPEYDHV